MEPNYIGANQRMEAMSIVWLFSKGYLYFDEGEIVWNGAHHEIGGLSFDLDKIDEIPEFLENSGVLEGSKLTGYFRDVAEFLLGLEEDEALIVPREDIHPGVHRAIGEGDLTGLTLFNLMGDAHAFCFIDTESEDVKRDVVCMAGLDAYADNPAVMENLFVIAVDQRLSRGIPRFYQLVRRMFEDMQSFNGVDQPFALLFVAAQSFNAESYFDDVEDVVDGAVSEAFHVETNIEGVFASQSFAPQGAILESEAEENDEDEFSFEYSGISMDGEEEGLDERATVLALLRTVAIVEELKGSFSSISEDLLEELERAERGDETVDFRDLACRFSDALKGHDEDNYWDDDF